MSRREREERKGVHTDTKGILVPLVSSAIALALPLSLRILLFCFIDESGCQDGHDAWYDGIGQSAMVSSSVYRLISLLFSSCQRSDRF
jgi:hypothetical protein